METCKFGADHQKLEGAKRKTFIAKCMANRNDKRGAMKLPAKKPAAKKPQMAKKPMAKQACRHADGAGRPSSSAGRFPVTRNEESPCRKPIKRASATRPTARRPRPDFSSKARTSSTGA